MSYLRRRGMSHDSEDSSDDDDNFGRDAMRRNIKEGGSAAAAPSARGRRLNIDDDPPARSEKRRAKEPVAGAGGEERHLPALKKAPAPPPLTVTMADAPASKFDQQNSISSARRGNGGAARTPRADLLRLRQEAREQTKQDGKVSGPGIATARGAGRAEPGAGRGGLKLNPGKPLAPPGQKAGGSKLTARPPPDRSPRAVGSTVQVDRPAPLKQSPRQSPKVKNSFSVLNAKKEPAQPAAAAAGGGGKLALLKMKKAVNMIKVAKKFKVKQVDSRGRWSHAAEFSLYFC